MTSCYLYINFHSTEHYLNSDLTLSSARLLRYSYRQNEVLAHTIIVYV